MYDGFDTFLDLIGGLGFGLLVYGFLSSMSSKDKQGKHVGAYLATGASLMGLSVTASLALRGLG